MTGSNHQDFVQGPPNEIGLVQNGFLYCFLSVGAGKGHLHVIGGSS